MARPKRVFSDEELQLIEQYARINCNTETIADGMDIPVTTLRRRFGRQLTHWRASGKLELRGHLYKQAVTSPQTAIFIAKNELGMVDKQTITTEIPAVKMTEEQRKALEEVSKDFKLRMA